MTKKYNYTKKKDGITNDTGRPTKYKKSYCKAIVEYFTSQPYKEVEVTHTNKKGEEWTHSELRANPLPTIEGFCAKINIAGQTLIEWTKKHEKFHAAYTRAKQLQKHHLVVCGLLGLYNPLFAKFVAINATDMVERSEAHIEVSGLSITDLAAVISAKRGKA